MHGCLKVVGSSLDVCCACRTWGILRGMRGGQPARKFREARSLDTTRCFRSATWIRRRAARVVHRWHILSDGLKARLRAEGRLFCTSVRMTPRRTAPAETSIPSRRRSAPRLTIILCTLGNTYSMWGVTHTSSRKRATQALLT